MQNGCQYGVLPLGYVSGTSRDEFEFLVFGGIEANLPYDVMDRTCTFRTRISDFKDSSFELLVSTVDCPSPMLDKMTIIKECVKYSNAWRVHSVTSVDPTDAPSMEDL
jgi:hypothetical protein